MSDLFRRSTQAIDSDGPRPLRTGLVLGATLLTAWMLWFFIASIPVYSATDKARVEVDTAAHPIESIVDGQVVAIHGSMGTHVNKGDVLVELSARNEDLQQREEELRAAGAKTSADRLRHEVALQMAALDRTRRASEAGSKELEAKYKEAAEAAHSAESTAARTEALFRSGLVADEQRDRARSEAMRQRVAADGLQSSLQRFLAEQDSDIATKTALIEQLKSQLATAEGLAGSSSVTTQRLENEREQRIIRAPVGGVLAESFRIREGSMVKEGDHLSSILPGGKLIVVAQFAPVDAIGKIRTGLRTRVRLQGFSWLEYGALEGRVTRVAEETNDGSVRVEIALDPSHLNVSLQHGLPAVAEVEIERLSPAALVFRTVGKRFSSAEPSS